MTDLLANLAMGFRGRRTTLQHPVLLAGRAGRHPGRRAARHRHRRHHCDAAAHHLRSAADRRPDHARRHLLWRAVRRVDHLDPGQYSGRGDLGGHRARRPPDGEAGPGRRGAVDRRHRLLLCRLRRHRAGGRARRPVDRSCPAVRAGRVFLADGAGLDLCRRARQGLGAQGGRHDRHGAAAVDGRLRPRDRRRAHDFRHPRVGRRHRLRQHRYGGVRLCGDHSKPRVAAREPRRSAMRRSAT